MTKMSPAAQTITTDSMFTSPSTEAYALLKAAERAESEMAVALAVATVCGDADTVAAATAAHEAAKASTRAARKNYRRVGW